MVESTELIELRKSNNIINAIMTFIIGIFVGSVTTIIAFYNGILQLMIK